MTGVLKLLPDRAGTGCEAQQRYQSADFVKLIGWVVCFWSHIVVDWLCVLDGIRSVARGNPSAQSKSNGWPRLQ